MTHDHPARNASQLLQEAGLANVRVRLCGRHRHRGKRGTVVSVESTPLGMFPVVELDDGHRVMVTHSKQFVRL